MSKRGSGSREEEKNGTLKVARRGAHGKKKSGKQNKKVDHEL